VDEAGEGGKDEKICGGHVNVGVLVTVFGGGCSVGTRVDVIEDGYTYLESSDLEIATTFTTLNLTNGRKLSRDSSFGGALV
jgi:hypothetical protein